MIMYYTIQALYIQLPLIYYLYTLYTLHTIQYCLLTTRRTQYIHTEYTVRGTYLFQGLRAPSLGARPLPTRWLQLDRTLISTIPSCLGAESKVRTAFGEVKVQEA